MNQFEKSCLKRSLRTLKTILPCSADALMNKYEADETMWLVDEINDLVFCLFSFPVTQAMEQVILLVYDDQNRIIADAGAFHCDVSSFLEQSEIYDYLSEESDWMYLEHYILSKKMFPGLPYPFCDQDQKANEAGEVLLFSNAYVSKAFRRRGIFCLMMEIMKEHALRNATGMSVLCGCISLDPDIACYGPDTVKEPYYYSFEADEPIRRVNAEIAEHTGFTPLRLETDNPEAETDGTKLWFAIRKEIIEIIEEPVS